MGNWPSCQLGLQILIFCFQTLEHWRFSLNTQTLGEPSRQRVLTVGFYVPFHVGDDKALLRTDSLAVFLFLHIILFLEICRLWENFLSTLRMIIYWLWNTYVFFFLHSKPMLIFLYIKESFSKSNFRMNILSLKLFDISKKLYSTVKSFSEKNSSGFWFRPDWKMN